jgi:5-methylcytosine-specific restriction endonuclease McrA
VRFCDTCKAERVKPTDQDGKQHTKTTGYTEDIDKQRKSARWQRTRERAIRKCPMCARCDIALSEIVDHIVPAEVVIRQAIDSRRYPYDRWAGYYFVTNRQGLCRPCHFLKTMEDKAHVGPWRDAIAIEAAAPKRVWTV